MYITLTHTPFTHTSFTHTHTHTHTHHLHTLVHRKRGSTTLEKSSSLTDACYIDESINRS